MGEKRGGRREGEWERGRDGGGGGGVEKGGGEENHSNVLAQQSLTGTSPCIEARENTDCLHGLTRSLVSAK